MQITPSFLKTKLKAVRRRLHQHSFLSPFRPKKLKRRKTSPNLPRIPYSKFTPSSLIYHLKSQKNPYILITTLAIILILAPAIYFLTKNPKQTEAAWFNDSWMYRKKIIIGNQSSYTLTDIPYITELDTATLITDGKLQSDGDDIRVIDNHGQLVKFQVEQSSLNTSETGIWFEADVQPDSSAIYYVYYGNSSTQGVDFDSDIASVGDGTTVTTNDGFTYTTSTSYGRISDIQKDSVNLGVNGTYRETDSYPGTWWNDRAFTRTLMASGPLFAEVKMSDTAYGHYSSYGTVIHIFDNGFVHNRVYMNYNDSGSEDLYYYLNFDTDTRNSVWIDSSESLINQGTDSGTLYENDLGHSWFGQLWTGSGHYGGNIVYKTGSDWHHGNTSAQASYYQTNFSYSEAYTNESSRNIRFAIFAGDGGVSEMQEKASSYGAHTVNASSEENSPGPIAYWKFDEGYGTTANNSTSTQNINGTIGTSASWKSEDQCINGKCLFIDDSGTSTWQTVIVNDSPALTNHSAITVGIWVKTVSNKNIQQIIYKRQSGGTPTWWSYKLELNSLKPTFYVVNSSGTSVSAQSDIAIELNKWYYLTGVYDGSQVQIHVNSKPADSTPANLTGSILDSDYRLQIGGLDTANTYYFNGFLDDVKIYPYARSADQTKIDYQQGMSALLGHKNQVFMSDGLVGYWKMDEASANTCSGGVNDSCDSSGSGNDGAWNGNATSTTGKFSNSTTFDGIDDYINILDSSNFATIDSNDTITVSAWIYQTAQTNYDRILNTGWANNGAWLLGINTSYKPNFVIKTNDIQYTASDADTISTDSWHHLVGVYDGSYVRLYVDGIAQTPAVCNNCDLDNGSSNIRISDSGTTEGFTGKIDEVRIYNRALSPKEVRDLYNWAPGPVGYWKMDEGMGTSAYDTSGNDNTGTLTNSPSWTQGQYGGGIKFTDNNDYVTFGNPSILNFGNNNNFTIGFWAKTNNTNNKFPIYHGYASNPGYFFYGRTFGITDGTDYSTTASDEEWRDGNWHYITGTVDRDNDIIAYYIDGIQSATASIAGAGNIDSTLNLKLSGYGGLYDWDGSIDDVRIYNYARTPGQIIEDMNADHPIGGSPISSKLLHLNLDQAYGTVAQDSGLNQDNGELLDGATWTTSGKYNHGIDLDGLNDRIQSFTSDPFEYTGNDLTLSIWINPDSGEGTGRIFSKPWNGSGQYNYVFFLNSNDTLTFYLLGATSWSTTTTTTIPEGSWSHVAVTVKEGTNAVKIYKNGNLIKSDTHNITGWTPTSGDSNVSLCIGSLYPYSSGWAGNQDFSLDGQIDEAKIYNTALTEDQIKLDMNQGASSVFGSLSTASDGSTPDNSASRKYCVPGDTSTCNPPVAEWKLDEKTGTSAYDTSENGNTGTLINSPTWKSAAECKQGACLDFNGTDESVSLSSLPSISAPYTIETWIYPQELNRTQTFLSLKGGNSYPVFNLHSNNKLLVYAGSEKYRYGSNVFDSNDLNKWWHIALVVQSSSSLTDWKVYVNGTDDTGASGANTGTYYDPSTSGAISSGNDYFNGQIDAVRIYNYARTPAQIAWDYNRGQPVGYWKLDECQGLTAYDSSGNGNNGTISIGASPTNTSAGTCDSNINTEAWNNGTTGKQNASLDFDGTDDYINLNSINIVGENEGSISAWIKAANWDANRMTIFSSEIGPSWIDLRFVLFSNSNNSLTFSVANGTSSTQDNANTGTILSTDTWYHVVGTYNGSQVKIFVDGIEKDSYNSSIVPGSFTSTKTTIGWHYDNRYWNGQIDDVRIYNYALTDQQIKILHNFGSTIYFSL